MSVRGYDKFKGDIIEALTNLDTGSGAVSLAESSPHSSLEPIGSGTGQHFVDAENMKGVDPDPDVETVLAAVLDEILVAADTASLQSLGGQLLTNSSETKWTDRGNSSTPALLRPRS